MNIDERIEALAELGERFRTESFLDKGTIRAIQEANPWFTPYMLSHALKHWGRLMQKDTLYQWVRGRQMACPSVRVSVWAAGNLPMVVWHDVLSVLLSGAHLLLKLSHKDAILPRICIETLCQIEPRMPVTLIDSADIQADMMIFTGGDAAKLQIQSLCSVPLLARGHRRSVAVLHESMSDHECQLLLVDALMYFGMGCRSVSHLYIPHSYAIERLLDSWRRSALPLLEELQHHPMWRHRLKYQRAVYQTLNTPFHDLGYALLCPYGSTEAPVTTVTYSRYAPSQWAQLENLNKSNWQICVDGRTIPYGMAQYPDLQWFADGLDTLEFIRSYSELIVKKN